MIENKEFEIQVEIENTCLLNCVHCSSYDTRKLAKRLYPDETLANFVSSFSGPVHVYFTGGDPILYPGIITLCERISRAKQNVTIGLYTTGNCPEKEPISDELAKQLAKAGVMDCYLSIYHYIEEKHDAFTGCLGAFQNTISSAAKLKSAGIQPKTHLVLNKQNYNDLDTIIHFCIEQGFEEIRILRLAPSGKAKHNWSEIGVSLKKQDEIITTLMGRKDHYGAKLTFSGYPHLHPCRASMNAIKCQAGTNLVYVNAVGDVFPCACTLGLPEQFKLGNIGDAHKVLDKIEALYSHDFNESCLNPW